MLPPWITQATGPVEELIARNIENEKKRLENVMLAKERDIAQEDRICRGIAYSEAFAGGIRKWKIGKKV